ncbi:MAG TPA: helix-turn-helix transcriptional regulator [Frankiaceae bacterium]|jgi:transcriptional regulator with XRE-family HTH domain|nr:helix-turn-helix transcriptional regulator [Frankiaceae bacterium]
MSELLSEGAALEPPWTANDGTFGARLALIRQRMGWNAKEAALVCGLAPQSWRTWESGTMPHGSRYFEICAKIAAAANCDYGWLVDRRPNEKVGPTQPKLVTQLRAIKGEGRDSRPRTPLLLPVPT